MIAKIVSNVAVCPICEQALGRQIRYGLVSHNDGQTYTQFTRGCDKCRGEYSYCLKMGIDTHDRYAIEEDELKEVRGND